MISKKWQGLIGLSVMVAMLSACTSNGTTKDNKPEGTAAETSSPTAKPRTGPVEINLVTPDATINEAYLKELKDKFPNYIIKHINQSVKGSSVVELLTAGVPIDIVGRAASVYPKDVLDTQLQYDMTSLLKQYKINVVDFEPQLISFVKRISNGGIYGIPGGSAINHALFYNKTLFNQFGVPYPKDGMLWTEALDLAAKMTRMDNGKQIFGFTGATNIMMSTNQLGISYVDIKTNKPTINQDKRWLSYFNTIYNNTTLNAAYRSENRPFSGGTASLLKGDTAMVLFNASIALITKELIDNTVDWDMVALPSFAEAPRTGSPMNSTLWGITSKTRDKEAAMDIINYMVSDESLGKLSRKGYLVPKQTETILKTFASEATPADKNWKSVLYNKFAEFPNATVNDSAITTIVTKYIEHIVKGEVDVNTALRKSEEEALKVIESNAQK